MSTVFSSSDPKNKENVPFSKDNPFLGKIKERQLLNKQGSSKKTYHISIDISGSNLTYQEGDAIAVFPSNPKNLVDFLINFFNEKPSTIIKFTKKSSLQEMTVEKCLSDFVNITRVGPQLFDLVKNFSSCSNFRSELEFLSAPEKKEQRITFMQSHDVISILKKAKALSCSLQECINTLSPLLPRFYSIASSQVKTPESIDLLVATFSYEIHGEIRTGIGSEFLCALAHNETPIPLYIHSNPNFKLPENIHTPVIMIGPGTGLAPFRGFIQKRLHMDPSSKNWLFFGERNQSLDFYYQNELTHLETQGSLKLSLAFSRDQEKKVYVQDKLLEHKLQLWDWVKNGAYIYICGDAKSMAKDVLHALSEIFASEGALSEEQVKAYLLQLRKTKQLQMDVY